MPCVEANIQPMSNTPIISLSSNPMTFYSKVMKLEEVKRKLIDAKNKTKEGYLYVKTGWEG